MSWHIRVSLAAALLLPATLLAQGREQREALWRWHDSLQQITDTTQLRTLLRAHLSRADSARGEPMAELRLGVLSLRLAEVSGDARLVGQAARGFTSVTEDHPDWPTGWTGLAQAELAEARRGTSVTFGLAQMFGLDPEGKIVALYLRGSGADSSMFEGIIDLSRRALRGRVEVEEQVALRVLRQVPARSMARSPEIALLRARLEREVGEKDSAIAVIERAARLHEDDPLILRSQAQTRFVVGRPDGAGPWYRGLERARDEALLRYERDLQMVVPDSIMTRLRAARAGQRGEIVRDFWRSQDPDGLPTHDDRLAEHYRRLEFARHNYVRPSVTRAIAEFELDTLGIDVFDARGEMILRHGTPRVRTSIGDHGGPDVEVTLRIIGMPANESWAYTDVDGSDRFYHFVKPGKLDDFRSVESVLDILAFSEQFKRFRPDAAPLVAGDTSHRTVLVHGAELVSIVAQELLVSRHQLSPLYSAMINEGIGAADSTQTLERVIGREALAVEYSYELGFEMPLDAAVEVLAVGSDQHGPILQVAFAISGADLTPQTMPRGVVYPIRMRVAVVDGAGRIVSQVDTTRGFLSPARLRPSQQLVGQLPLRVPPGEYRVRVALEAERRGYLSRPVMVELTAGRESLTLSDISIGVRSVPIQWRSPTADTAWANPRGRYRTDEELQLYFEVGGLEEGTTYRTQIAIDRVEAGATTGCNAAGTALTLSFEGEHPGRVAREQRAVALDRLRPDNYLMAVTITTESGARATRCRQFTVVRE